MNFIVSKIAQNTDQMCQLTIVYLSDFQSLSKKHKSFKAYVIMFVFKQQ